MSMSTWDAKVQRTCGENREGTVGQDQIKGAKEDSGGRGYREGFGFQEGEHT